MKYRQVTKRGEPAEPLEKKHKDSANTTAATERLGKKHKGNDIGTFENIVTVADDQQAHTLFVQIEAGRITKGTEQDVIMRMMAQGNPDTMVTLSQTVNEQQTGTKVNIKESTIFAMRMCPDQIPYNKYFAHVWPRLVEVGACQKYRG